MRSSTEFDAGSRATIDSSAPVVLTIAGSDASGGAGIQADLKTFHTHAVYGMSAITAVTAQNTQGVVGVETLSVDFVAAQIHAAASDIPPDAVKTGMLANRSIVEVVVKAADQYGWDVLVVDPVMIATTGSRLIDHDAVDVLCRELLPRATIVTPNAPEAGALLNTTITDETTLEMAADAIIDQLGAQAVLVKGGDLEGDQVVDVYCDGTSREVFRAPRIATTSTHGSGCALASAIAARLALGQPLETAVRGARHWVRQAIERAPGLGSGRGPLDLLTPVVDVRETL
jgi:hydroxymethylpyrimidine/phosphomethylpyrimidine kinase